MMNLETTIKFAEIRFQNDRGCQTGKFILNSRKKKKKKKKKKKRGFKFGYSPSLLEASRAMPRFD
jgi:hypothetical protein